MREPQLPSPVPAYVDVGEANGMSENILAVFSPDSSPAGMESCVTEHIHPDFIRIISLKLGASRLVYTQDKLTVFFLSADVKAAVILGKEIFKNLPVLIKKSESNLLGCFQNLAFQIHVFSPVLNESPCL